MKKKVIKEPKKRDTPKNKFNLKLFIKYYPGTFIGIIIATIIILLFVTSTVLTDENYAEKSMQAAQIHYTNQNELNYLIEIVRTFKNDPEYEIDFDYYESMEHDFVWLKERDNSIFEQRKSEINSRQFASLIFLNILIALNDEVAYEFLEFDRDGMIQDAKNINLTYENIVWDELEEIFEGEPKEKEAFKETITELVQDYERAKKEILNGDYSNERKYIEAKKLMTLSYY